MRPCILLFGSMARGDSGESSDVDILVSEEFGKIFSERTGRMEVQYTPQGQLLDMAESGNLFTAHIAFEAKVISDPDGFLQLLSSSFKAKQSYSLERNHALSLAAYLSKKFVTERQISIRNKKIAWCVRTTLISLIAERGEFVFSPQGLVESYPGPHIEKLLSCRRSSRSQVNINRSIRWFLREFDGETYAEMSRSELKREFRAQKNAVGLSTIESLKSINTSHIYK